MINDVTRANVLRIRCLQPGRSCVPAIEVSQKQEFANLIEKLVEFDSMHILISPALLSQQATGHTSLPCASQFSASWGILQRPWTL